MFAPEIFALWLTPVLAEDAPAKFRLLVAVMSPPIEIPMPVEAAVPCVMAPVAELMVPLVLSRVML